MKKNSLSVLIALFVFGGLLTSCTKNDPDPVNTDPLPFLFGTDGNQSNTGTQIGNGDQEFAIVPGNYTLPKNTYVMKGWIYVSDGATLTIPAGTVIKGDKDTKAALIVEPGGKIIAQGTSTQPIIFTSNQPTGSRKPGDWGGVILCGNAKNNQAQAQIEGGPRTTYGGSNDDDNSGVLSYVRIEFAGYPFAVDKEINGLTMGSVGRGTKIDHIQVSYSNDDSYEWFGGTVNCKYLIAYHGWDDDFDTDFGFSGHNQFLLGVRNPRIADASVSNGFESDNDGSGSTKEPFTSAVFSNVTMVGPVGQDAAFVNNLNYINAGNVNPNNGSKLGPFQAAVQIRRNSHESLFNSVFMGYPVGLIIENDKGSATQDAANNSILKVRNNVFAQMDIKGTDLNKSFKAVFSSDGINGDESKTPFSVTYLENAANKNQYFSLISDLKLRQPNSTAANASWMPTTGSPLLNGADFTDVFLTGLDQVKFIGAFGTDDWTTGWTNFEPQTTTY